MIATSDNSNPHAERAYRLLLAAHDLLAHDGQKDISSTLFTAIGLLEERYAFASTSEIMSRLGFD